MLFHTDFFTIVQLEQGDQASSGWPDPTKLDHRKGCGFRTLSHVPASFWTVSFGIVAQAVKYRLARYSGSIYVMFDHDWHTLTWRHLGTRRPEVLLSSSSKNLSSVFWVHSLTCEHRRSAACGSRSGHRPLRWIMECPIRLGESGFDMVDVSTIGSLLSELKGMTYCHHMHVEESHGRMN